MSELADELALHAKPEHVKEVAAEKVSEWKERAKELAKDKAVELKEQAKEAISDKASEIKTHAKEAVMQKTMDVKERVDTPRGWRWLGAIIGAGVGSILMKKAFSVREERSWRSDGFDREGIGFNTDTSAGVDVKERVSDAAHSVKDKAHDLKDRALGAVDQVRDRIPSGTEMKGRATDWFDRAVEHQPLMLALGSMALGVFASLFIPVTNRERQLIEPAKRKAQEGLSQLGDQLEQKLQGSQEETGSNVGMSGSGMGSMGSSTTGSMGRSEELMGAERPGFTGEDRSDSLASPTGSRIPPLPPLDDLSSKIH